MSKIATALVLVSISILLQGCAVSVPAMAEMERGEKFIGTTTATPLGGSYNLQSVSAVMNLTKERVRNLEGFLELLDARI